MKLGHWHTKNKPSEDDIGFTYMVRNISTGEYYYGVKKLYKKIKRPPLKGKKRNRIDYIESDWKTYTTSGTLKEDIENNPNDYFMEILQFHKTITDMKVEEAHLIIHAISDKLCMNEMLNIRLRIRK